MSREQPNNPAQPAVRHAAIIVSMNVFTRPPRPVVRRGQASPLLGRLIQKLNCADSLNVRGAPR